MVIDRLVHDIKEGDEIVPRFVVSTVNLDEIAEGQYETIVFLGPTGKQAFGERHFSAREALVRHYQIMYDIVVRNLVRDNSLPKSMYRLVPSN